MAYKRSLYKVLRKRLLETPFRIQIVSGPRQTGKTTLVNQVCNDLFSEKLIKPHFYAVDNPDRQDSSNFRIGGEEVLTPPDRPDIDWLSFQWNKARFSITNDHEDDNKLHVLVFDEIQKIPNWSEAVKGLWDQDRRDGVNLHVVLLGSSPLLMQQGLTESLAGRFEKLTNTHWSFNEMSEAFGFTLDEYIYFGGYPGGASLIREEDRWLDYIRFSLIEPNIQKDIVAMTNIHKPALLKLLFEFGCEYSSQVYAYNNMLGQLKDAGNTTTLAHYLELLSNAGLLTGIMKFTPNKGRIRSSSPKLNVLNTALMSCFSNYTFQEALSDRTYWGRQAESAVGAHLINTCAKNTKIYYWRESRDEVDYILKRGEQLLAIEVKSHQKRIKTSGLNKFLTKFPSARPMLVGSNGVSFQEFLSYNADHWFN